MSSASCIRKQWLCVRNTRNKLASIALCVFVLGLRSIECHNSPQLDVVVDNMTLCTANLDYYYVEPSTSTLMSKIGVFARYGASSKCASSDGTLIHVEDDAGLNHGCTPHRGRYPPRKWIALVQRGSCKFDQKIYQATRSSNATAIVVYNNKDEGDVPLMYHMVSGVIAVFIHRSEGVALANLVDQGVVIQLHIRVRNVTTTIVHADSHSAKHHDIAHGFGDAASNSSLLLYISLTLVTLLIVGLGGLLVYGLHRAKRRQQRRNNTRVVYAENGDVHGFLVEERIPGVAPRPPPHRVPHRHIAATRNIYTTIPEEEEEETCG